MDREIVSSKERKLVSRLEAGAGRSASFISGIGYGFLGGSLASSEHFAKSMQIGGTAEIGWNGSLIGSDSSLLSAQAKHFEFGEKDTQFSLSVGQSFKLDTNLALVVEYQKGWESETEFFDVRSGVAWYY